MTLQAASIEATLPPGFSIECESTDHRQAIETLHESAFGPGRFARAAFRIREQGGHDVSLSFVAVVSSALVGSVRLTWITTTVSGSMGLLLGPLAVSPDMQKLGIGRALVAKCREVAAGTDAGYVLLVGDAPYYEPLGFEVVKKGALQLPAPVDLNRLLICPLNGFDLEGIEGLVRHAQQVPG